jgi:hypothetical protein
MNRRNFLRLSGLWGGAALVSGGAYLVGEELLTSRPKRSPDRVLADLHCHFPSDLEEKETLEVLTSGLFGLTLINGGEATTLTYEKALQLPGTEEIDRGFFARINYLGNTGYFVKTQELKIREDFEYHLLAVGIKEYLPDFSEGNVAIEEARKQGALLILNHPFVTANDHPLVKYRPINAQEEKRIREISLWVDEVEVFNGHNVNTHVPFIPNMHLANEAALEMAEGYGFKGTAASDTHCRLEQAGTSGIFIAEKDLCFEALREAILKKKFERSEQYVSLLSFARGIFGI